MMTGRGHSLMMRLSASTPLSTGISTSRVITSGCNSLVFSTTSCPLRAVPQTRICGLASSMRNNAVRMTALSSAMSDADGRGQFRREVHCAIL